MALSLLALSGCGATSSTVDVGYPEPAANRAMLSSAPPRRIAISPVAARRMETARIGSRPKANGAPSFHTPEARSLECANHWTEEKGSPRRLPRRPGAFTESFLLDGSRAPGGCND